MSDQVPKIKEGPPIYNESLMSSVEYSEYHKKYSATCDSKKAPDYFKSEFDWRYRMGARLTLDEIKLINSRIDEILKNAGI